MWSLGPQKSTLADPDLAGERVERGDVGVDQVHSPGGGECEAVTAMSGMEGDVTISYTTVTISFTTLPSPHKHIIFHCAFLSAQKVSIKS